MLTNKSIDSPQFLIGRRHDESFDDSPSLLQMHLRKKALATSSKKRLLFNRNNAAYSKTEVVTSSTLSEAEDASNNNHLNLNNNNHENNNDEIDENDYEELFNMKENDGSFHSIISSKQTTATATATSTRFVKSQQKTLRESTRLNTKQFLLLEKSRSNFELTTKASSHLIDEYFNEPAIMEALEKHESESSDTRLVGDMSTTHVLPLLKTSKHQDLASIASSTMIDLLNGKYDEQVDKYLIIDARFPYEYEGGHINGAENVYLIDDLFKRLFSNPIRPEQTGKRVIVIFHCEFSSERGPRLMREVRERDRLLNQHNYPNLFYPELYLLEGGYKSFFEHSTTALEFCAPRSYLPMVHDNHRDDLKFFRRKSKTWEMEAGRKPRCVTSKSKLAL